METILNELVETIADKVANQILNRFRQPECTQEQSSNMKLYTIKQLCEMLHMSKSKLYRHQKLGLIVPAKYVGRTPLYDQQSIDDYLTNFTY